MKKSIQVLILTLIFSTSINAQSTERFIRIIGNAKKEIKADRSKVYFSISEMKVNNYDKNSNDVTYKAAYNEVISKFSEIGIKENDIKNSLKNRNNYNRLKLKNFYIETDLNNLEKISNIVINGFRITDTKYIYSKTDSNLETELSLKAIKDAKRKAKAICVGINKKVGKILNVEVKEAGFSSRTKENKESNIIQTYKVTITFKLID
ncbi:MAG: SIMPL domain-containing protein [Polaribacter sp.]|nr:SIMPL domain-containing protein [Polaribacter sp.]